MSARTDHCAASVVPTPRGGGLRPASVACRTVPERGADGRITMFLLGLGVAVQLKGVPFNLQPVDLLLAALLLATVVRWVRSPDLAWSSFRVVAPALWVITCANLVGLTAAQLAGYSALQIVRDTFAFLILFVTLSSIERHERAVRALLAGLVAGALLCSVLVLTSTDLRPSGTFNNPNYAAHFLACLVLALLACPFAIRWRKTLIVVFLVAMVLTYSFGGLTFLLFAGAYRLWHVARGATAAVRLLARTGLVIALGVLVLSGLPTLVVDSATVQDTEFGAGHFDRSTGIRLNLYRDALALIPDHPLGVGPGSIVNEGLVGTVRSEVHSDPLAYLLERGVLGLVGLVLLFVLLSRLGRPGGPVRCFLVGVVVSCLSREILNFRHIWVILALLVLWEAQAARRAAAGDGPPAEDVAAGAPSVPTTARARQRGGPRTDPAALPTHLA